jgi:protein tyrosine phosphatase (PTP) superfamily phosphohydrolase (DUF442 family)
VEVSGVHNVFRVTDRLYSGSSPEGDAGFASLAQLGIKTIVSVDGARPEVELAKKHGLRYVHLPIGYDGVPQEHALKIARAVRDLPGPVFVHCHHGKHRAPAAAATVLLCLDPKCPVSTALAYMKAAGTDPHYRGLYDSPSKLRRPTSEELNAVPADFPDVAKVAALAETMVKIDQHWGRLHLVRKAAWKPPQDHPDIDPPHEALQLRELLCECRRLPELNKKYPEELRRRLALAETLTAELEQVLRTRKAQPVDAAEAEKHFQRVATSCVECHAHFRDVPANLPP